MVEGDGETFDGGQPAARPGEVLSGKHRVDRLLGVGGMAVVMAATHLDLGEPRAIKAHE